MKCPRCEGFARGSVIGEESIGVFLNNDVDPDFFSFFVLTCTRYW